MVSSGKGRAISGPRGGRCQCCCVAPFLSHTFVDTSQTRARDQDLSLGIRKIARLREYVWHPSPESLLTLSFPTELEWNPSFYLPTMNSTHSTQASEGNPDGYTTRYDCNVSFRLRRSWRMFVEDCRIQVNTTSSLLQSG
jgi:hypothetical protein